MNIVLSADVQFSEQVKTLIKSVCYHNKNVHFYLLNKDYPTEWFQILNQYLAYFGSKIVDAKVDSEIISTFPTLDHISEASYFRYLLGQLPLDRVLYLDCDMVVTGSLAEMYYADFGDNMMYAVEDAFLNLVQHSYKEFPDMKPYFNSGMLLIDLNKWREQNIENQLMDLTKRAVNVYYGDQDVLNIILKGKWKALDKIYNYQTGSRIAFIQHEMLDELKKYEDLQGQLPKIIHYITRHKPWLVPEYDLLFRNQYWAYYQLEWQDILRKWANEES
ncbi:glycosyltransferase family 8 protein [Bisgaard Taxon 46]